MIVCFMQHASKFVLVGRTELSFFVLTPERLSKLLQCFVHLQPPLLGCGSSAKVKHIKCAQQVPRWKLRLLLLLLLGGLLLPNSSGKYNGSSYAYSPWFFSYLPPQKVQSSTPYH